MDFNLSDEHRLIQETARRVAKEKIAPRAAELDITGEYPEVMAASASRRSPRSRSAVCALRAR